jgi:hypothetical protein
MEASGSQGFRWDTVDGRRLFADGKVSTTPSRWPASLYFTSLLPLCHIYIINRAYKEGRRKFLFPLLCTCATWPPPHWPVLPKTRCMHGMAAPCKPFYYFYTCSAWLHFALICFALRYRPSRRALPAFHRGFILSDGDDGGGGGRWRR